jgi:hypothetical protein
VRALLLALLSPKPKQFQGDSNCLDIARILILLKLINHYLTLDKLFIYFANSFSEHRSGRKTAPFLPPSSSSFLPPTLISSLEYKSKVSFFLWRIGYIVV